MGKPSDEGEKRRKRRGAGIPFPGRAFSPEIPLLVGSAPEATSGLFLFPGGLAGLAAKLGISAGLLENLVVGLLILAAGAASYSFGVWYRHRVDAAQNRPDVSWRFEREFARAPRGSVGGMGSDAQVLDGMGYVHGSRGSASQETAGAEAGLPGAGGVDDAKAPGPEEAVRAAAGAEGGAAGGPAVGGEAAAGPPSLRTGTFRSASTLPGAILASAGAAAGKPELRAGVVGGRVVAMPSAGRAGVARRPWTRDPRRAPRSTAGLLGQFARVFPRNLTNAEQGSAVQTAQWSHGQATDGAVIGGTLFGPGGAIGGGPPDTIGSPVGSHNDQSGQNVPEVGPDVNVTPYQGIIMMNMMLIALALVMLILSSVFAKMAKTAVSPTKEMYETLARVFAGLALGFGAAIAATSLMLMGMGQKIQGMIFTAIGAIIAALAAKALMGHKAKGEEIAGAAKPHATLVGEVIEGTHQSIWSKIAGIFKHLFGIGK